MKTPRGIGIGSTEAEVRRRYGADLIVQPADYDEEPAHSLTFWLKKDSIGVRFITDRRGRVTVIHAGTGSIRYVEGCL